MKKALLLILLIFILMPAQAQDEPEPLLEMLAQMPQALEGERAVLIYADMELAFAAWSAVPDAPNIEAYEALTESERERYLFSFPHAGFPNVSRMAASVSQAEILENFGFDYFSIEQSLYFHDGSFHPPSVMFNGDFDNEAIVNGRLEQGYSVNGEILCPENGCDDVFVETDEAFSENPFGFDGAFILGAGYLMNLTTPERLAATHEVLLGEAPSRLDVSSYRASANLLVNSGLVSQAVFIPTAYIDYVNEVITYLDDSEAQTLPEYQLVTLAELVFAEEERTEFHLLLVYENMEDAEAALGNLEENLRNPALFSRGFWDNVDAELGTIDIYEDSENNLFLLRAILAAPLPMAEVNHDPQSNSLFNIFYDSSIVQGDLRYLLVED